MIIPMRKTLNKDIFIIAIIFIAAIALQLFFLNTPILSDQMQYYFTAIRFPRLPSNPNIGSMRIGLELPVAVLYRIFGSCELTYYTVPLLGYALLAISIYLIGKGLFSRRVGIFSTLLFLAIPNLLQESGHLLPDIPATALATAGFAVLITAFGDSRVDHDFSSKKSIWIFILAGLLFGWAYLVKEYLAIVFFIIPLTFWILKIPFRHLIPVAAAMLFMYSIEVIVGIIYYQNPLIRFLAANPRETLGTIHKDVLLILSYFGRLLIKSGGEGILIIMLIGFLDSFVSSIKKNRKTLFLLSWILLIYILFTFAGLLPVIFDWEDIVLLRLHKFRYWIPILPPLIISSIVFLDKLFSAIFNKFVKTQKKIYIPLVMTLLLVLISIHGFITIWDYLGFIKNNYNHYLELRQYLKENDNEDDIIWIDRDNKRAFERILPLYVRNPFGGLIWHGKFKYINTESLYLRAEEIDVGYIIIDRDFMVPEFSNAPDYLADPPDNWELVFESENQKIALYAVE